MSSIGKSSSTDNNKKKPLDCEVANDDERCTLEYAEKLFCDNKGNINRARN